MISLYIESGDEITTVIERLRAATEPSVALVAPKGATLLQSVVNLKLARKAAADAGKEIVVVTTDKIGRNLCAQLGLPVASTEEEAVAVLQGTAASAESDDAKVIAGVRIHHYYEEEDGADDNAPTPDPIIIPKQLLKEETPAAEEPIAVPAGIPEPTAPAEVVEPVAPPVVDTPMSRRTVTRDDEPSLEEVAAVAVASEKAMKTKKAAVPPTANQKRVIKLSLFLGGIGLLAIATLAFLFLPMTTVVVAVRATEWNKDLAFTASTEATNTNADHTVVPAEVISATSEKTHSFKATGSKDVGEKATGTVTFSNSSTTNKLTIPEGTTITAGGKTFVTNAAAIVDGLTISGGKITPGSGSSPITATEAGAGSNMSNTLGNNVAVGKDSVSTVVTASGGSSKTVTVVSSQDLVDAKAELVKQLTDDVKVKLADLLANRTLTFKADSDKLEMGDVSSTVPVGAEAEGGEVKGSASIRRTVVETSKLDNAISDRLRGEQLTTKSYQVTSKEITVATQSEDGKLMTLSAKLAGKEAPIVPIEEFPALLSGKSFAAGEKLIEDQVPTATTATTQRPGWWPIKRHPSVNRYILIDLKYE